MVADDEEGFTVKLRAEINIDIDAVDYLDAAEHQKRVEALLGELRGAYPRTVLVVRPRRAARARSLPAGARVRHYTGRLHSYD